MKSIFRIIIIFAYTCWSFATLSAQRIEYYGVNPLWGIKYEKPFEIKEINNKILDTLFSGVSKSDRAEKQLNVQKFVEEIESSKKNKANVYCYIGFYFKDIDNNLVIDFYVLNKSNLEIKASKRLILDIKQKNDLQNAANSFANPNSKKYADNSVRNFLFRYLLMYQANYYSKKPLILDIDSLKLAKIAKRKPMEINGEMEPRQVFDEIERIFNSKKSSDTNAFQKSSQYCILKICDKLSPTMPRKYQRYQKKYREFFNSHPIVLSYIKVAVAYHAFKFSNHRDKDHHKKVLAENLNSFFESVDTADHKAEDVSFFNKYKFDINEIRNNMAIRFDQLIKCTKNSSLPEELNGDEYINESIYYYYDQLKYCNDGGSFNNLSKLYSKREQLFNAFIKNAIEFEKQDSIVLAIESYIKGRTILPYMPGIELKVNSLLEKAKNRMNRNAPSKIHEEFEEMIDTKIIESKLKNATASTFKYKTYERSVTIKRRGQTIDIILTPLKNQGTDLTAQISYYPVGKFTYPYDEIDNSTITSAIYDIYNHYSKTDSFGKAIRPEMTISFKGSADLTRYRGAVDASPYNDLNSLVIPCDNTIPKKMLQHLKQIPSTNFEKNLALSFFRAHHKEMRIMQQCADIKLSILRCAEVVENGDVSDRSVTIAIQVVIK